MATSAATTQQQPSPEKTMNFAFKVVGDLAAMMNGPLFYIGERLGITGGLSILGTTGVVVPYSCAAWIAGIHQGVDVGFDRRTGEREGAARPDAEFDGVVSPLVASLASSTATRCSSASCAVRSSANSAVTHHPAISTLRRAQRIACSSAGK